MGIVTDYSVHLIQRQVDEKGVVVWFDPGETYASLVNRIVLPGVHIARFAGSYLELRHAVDAWINDIDSETPPRLVLYIPHQRAETGHLLDEYTFAGSVIGLGEPIPRNTSLEAVARQALRTHFARERLEEIVENIRKGRITSLDELDQLAEQGDTDALALIFSAGQPFEIAQQFLFTDNYDAQLVARDALELQNAPWTELYGTAFPEGQSPEAMRARLQMYLLISEFKLRLEGDQPKALDTIRLPESRLQQGNCLQLVASWRNRRDMQQRYADAARQAETEFGLDYAGLSWKALQNVETFQGVEERLQAIVEEALVILPTMELVALAHRRRAGFWSEVEELVRARWALIASTGELLLKANALQQTLRQSPPSNAAEYIQSYTGEPDQWYQLDTLHRGIERLALALDFDSKGKHATLERLLARARQEYAWAVDALSRGFVTALAQANFTIGNILYQNEIFARYVSPALSTHKIAYIIVDALRYEMALDLADSLDRDWKVEVLPAIATPPTITPVGMAALLPGAERGMSLSQAGELVVEVGGQILKSRKERIAYMASKVPGFYDVKLEMLVPAKKTTREALRAAKFILVTSQEIDLLGEGDSIAQAREFMDSALAKLARAFRVLIDHGVERIVVSADHGYIFSEELETDLTIPAPGGQTVDLHRRVWIGKGGQALDGVLRTTTQALNLGGDLELATPLGLACFAAPGGKAYFHGGLSLQELIIPVFVLEPLATAQPTAITWNLIPGREKITTRFYSVQIEGTIPSRSMFEGEPPLVRVEIRARNNPVSRAVTATYGLQEATGELQMRWKADQPFGLEPNTVALMLTGEVSEKNVSVLLIDAETEKTLGKIDVEVAISI